MATCTPFARLADYSCEFGKVSHIFLKKAFGECRQVWQLEQMSTILAISSLASSMRWPLWSCQTCILAKFTRLAKLQSLQHEVPKNSIFMAKWFFAIFNKESFDILISSHKPMLVLKFSILGVSHQIVLA